jgi:F-type H+-transporting ATPase subunit gamma
MAAGKELKRRIKSIKNTKKITKAMELVSASKMKRAIAATLASRAYAGYSWEVLQSLAEYVSETKNPFLTVKPVERILVVLVTSNRSLCGGYNAQITRKAVAFIRENEGKTVDYISIGSKGESNLRRLGQNIIASFNDMSATPKLSDVYPVASFILDTFKKGEYDRVCIAYTDFVSALTQVPRISTILPVNKEQIISDIAEMRTVETPVGKIDYVFEPNYETLMASIVEKIARMRVYQMILESTASEHSARMMAMKNASDAAGEMIEDLTLAFNKARQAGITQEISEISAGMASVS